MKKDEGHREEGPGAVGREPVGYGGHGVLAQAVVGCSVPSSRR